MTKHHEAADRLARRMGAEFVPTPPCLLWSTKWNKWWRANGCGYTGEIAAAGLYTSEQARRLAGGETQIIAIAAARQQVEAEIAEHESAIARLRGVIAHLDGANA